MHLDNVLTEFEYSATFELPFYFKMKNEIDAQMLLKYTKTKK